MIKQDRKFFRTVPNTSSGHWITISIMRISITVIGIKSSNVGTPANTLSCGWICVVTGCLTVQFTHVVLVVVVRLSRTFQNAFICRVISTWVQVRITFVHTSPVVIICKRVHTIIHASACFVISIVRWDTSWVANPRVRICIKSQRTNFDTNSLPACLVVETVSVSMDWALCYTYSGGWICIAFRTNALTNRVNDSNSHSIIEPKCTLSAFEDTFVFLWICSIKRSVLTIKLTLSGLGISVVLG